MNKIITHIKANKTVYIIGGTLLAVGIIYLLIKSKTAQTQASATQSDIDTLSKTQTQSYPDSTYFNLADQLDSILDSVFVNMDDVLAIFTQMNNTLDVLKLIQSYSTKFHFGFSVGIGSVTLPVFMQDELSTDKLAQVNQLLQSKGINYTF